MCASWSLRKQIQTSLLVPGRMCVMQCRWKLLPSEGERRAVFDELCKNVAMEQKELAAAAARQSVDAFK